MSNHTRNFGDAAKEGLKGTTRWVAYYFTNPKSWYPVPKRTTILPYRCSINFITCTNSTTEHTEDERLSANIWCSSASGGRRTSIRQKFSRVNRSASKSLTLRSSKKNKKTDEEENEILEYNSLPVMKNRMNHFRTTRPHVMMVSLSLERETHSLRERFFPLAMKYSLQQQNCVQLIFSLFPFLWKQCDCRHLFLFYAPINIVIRFFDTDLSLLLCFSETEV